MMTLEPSLLHLATCDRFGALCGECVPTATSSKRKGESIFGGERVLSDHGPLLRYTLCEE